MSSSSGSLARKFCHAWVAQTVRASDSYPEGRRFDPSLRYCAVVEFGSTSGSFPEDVGSNPTCATIQCTRCTGGVDGTSKRSAHGGRHDLKRDHHMPAWRNLVDALA